MLCIALQSLSNNKVTMETMQDYLQKIKSALASSSAQRDQGQYVDLAVLNGQPFPEDMSDGELPPDDLIGFQEIMMEEISHCGSDKIKIGINEMLKHLLTIINQESEQRLAERYMYRLKLIFKRCLAPDFPFPEEIWNYICDYLRSIGTYLLERGYFTATREIIDALAGMGRIAALKDLPTANTQSSLRILENKALAKGDKHLAALAKNARFNLET